MPRVTVDDNGSQSVVSEDASVISILKGQHPFRRAADQGGNVGLGSCRLGSRTLRRSHRFPQVGGASHTTSMTCVTDGLAHLVPDDAHAAGVAAGTGLYRALCGHQVAAAPLICPSGPSCARCHPRRVPLPSGRHRARAGVR